MSPDRHGRLSSCPWDKLGGGQHWPTTPYLKDDPVTLLCSQVQSLFSHHLLALPEGNVVEVPVVEGVAQFLP